MNLTTEAPRAQRKERDKEQNGEGAGTYRKNGYGSRFYNFLDGLAETARGEKNVVLVVSVPASELEYTPEDTADEARFKKMLDRLGKAILMSADTCGSKGFQALVFDCRLTARVGSFGRTCAGFCAACRRIRKIFRETRGSFDSHTLPPFLRGQGQ